MAFVAALFLVAAITGGTGPIAGSASATPTLQEALLASLYPSLALPDLDQAVALKRALHLSTMPHS